LVPLIDDNGSGSLPLWPSPIAGDSKQNGNSEAALALGWGGTLTDRAVRMWGTPVARDDQKSPEAHMAMKAAMPGGPRTEATSLTVQVKMWLTPKAQDGMAGNGMRSTQDGRQDEAGQLKAQVRMWPASRHAPTTTTDGPNGSPKADLNPRFVAALMGVPWDWLTPSTSAATDSSPPQPPTPSASSSTDWSTA